MSNGDTAMTDSATTRRALVCVVDDDLSVRESLPDLLGAFGFAAHTSASAEEFLASGQLEQAECLILDVAMPGMTGPELQMELKRRGHSPPIVFITAHVDEDLARRLITQGAVRCLFKPFSDMAILEAVTAALSSKK